MVGHGGASGYLAVLSLAGTEQKHMASTALILNVLVASLSVLTYARAGHLHWRAVWPFIALSVPAAFLGGMMPLSGPIYLGILALVLAYSAVELGMRTRKVLSHGETKAPPLAVALPLGAGIGWLSGTVGVGGGIFLSPLMLLKRWATPQETSAVSALFIVVNSIAGIAGRLAGGNFEVASCWHLIAAGFLGGLIGSHLGANALSRIAICRVLAVVLILAVVKLVLTIVSGKH
jgi:uncharacterized membrane protein YfcA